MRSAKQAAAQPAANKAARQMESTWDGAEAAADLAPRQRATKQAAR